VICSQCGTLNENQRDLCVRCRKALHPSNMKGKIACSVHANREATTSCAGCGIRLCESCAAHANGIDFCENCAPPDAIRHDYDEDYEKIPVVDPALAARASFAIRFLAFLMDSGIILAGAALIGFIVWAFTGRFGFFLSPATGIPFFLFWGIVILFGIAYSSILTSMSGQTMGKQLAGVIVLEPDGHILNLQKSTIRSFAAVLSAIPLGLGFLWVLWDKKGETWHDKLAKTAAFRWEEVS
jgi:uncharacterized RDD family membrane protein YckC